MFTLLFVSLIIIRFMGIPYFSNQTKLINDIKFFAFPKLKSL